MKKLVASPGDRFPDSNLTFVSQAESRSGFGMWNLLCDCGNQVCARSASVKSGHSKSCGCLYKEHLPRKPINEEATRQLLSSYKSMARRRGYKWSLTVQNFMTLIESNCHYCGTHPYQLRKGRRRSKSGTAYNGVDRVDNQDGYTLDNVVTCCIDCNRSKCTMSVDEFKEWLIDAYNTSCRANE